MKRLLVLSHGHPKFSIGGGENAAYAIHEQMGARNGWHSWFLAAAPAGTIPHGKDIMSLPNEKELLISSSNDSLLFSSECNLGIDSEVRSLVSEINPDVIHVHHFIHLGFDLLYAIKTWCPKALLVYTIHEFLLHCPLNGQLLTRDQKLCSTPSLQACKQCKPYENISDLIIRRESVHSFQTTVDHFIAPSNQLKKIFVNWGIKANRISVIENPLPEDIIEKGNVTRSKHCPQWRFGFFGTCAPSKGLDLLLEAMVQLIQKVPIATLIINGPIDNQASLTPPEHAQYWQHVHTLLDKLDTSVIVNGPYQQADVSSLMSQVGWIVMASRWLENSPVVIQEARACGRPLLVPGMGGMAEKAEDGIDGVHYQSNSVSSLTASMERCCVDNDLFTSLKKSIRKPIPTAQVIAKHEEIYTSHQKKNN